MTPKQHAEVWHQAADEMNAAAAAARKMREWDSWRVLSAVAGLARQVGVGYATVANNDG